VLYKCRLGATLFSACYNIDIGRAPYTLSVKLNDFTVCRQTWQKNWVIYAVLTCLFQSSFKHRTAQFTQEIPQFPQFTCRHHDGIISRHIHFYSADEHIMIYSFSNATSYCTFYAFCSSFRITLWPMWLANSKRQPCFYPPYSHAQEDTQNWQKTDKPDGKTVLCQRAFSSVFHAVFFLQS